MRRTFSLPLVNAHTHAAMVAFRGLAEDLSLDRWLNDYIWPLERKKLSPVFVYRETKKAIREMKRNGIRAFADMYFFADEIARATKSEKMTAVIAEGIIDFPTPSYKSPGEALIITESLLKKYKNDPYIKISVAPHSIYTAGKVTLLKAKKLARKYNALYHIHLAETKFEFDECLKKHSATPIGYLEKLGLLDNKTILVHCVWLTNKDINILAKRNVSVVHCPLSNLKLGSGIAPIGKLIQKGVNVALGTDGAASSNRLDIWEAGKIAALLQKGITNDPTQIPAKTAVEMMTINGLKALGLSNVQGRTMQDIETSIKKQKNFNFLYELNTEQLDFSS